MTLGAQLMTLGDAIIDDSRVMLQLVASFMIIIYDHHIFIVGHWFKILTCLDRKSKFCSLPYLWY
jgi:hypothetical protein